MEDSLLKFGSSVTSVVWRHISEAKSTMDNPRKMLLVESLLFKPCVAWIVVVGSCERQTLNLQSLHLIGHSVDFGPHTVILLLSSCCGTCVSRTGFPITLFTFFLLTPVCRFALGLHLKVVVVALTGSG